MTTGPKTDHSFYKDHQFTNRFIKHSDLQQKVDELRSADIFNVQTVGLSVQNREIWQLSIGKGPIVILLWSQMHGDEPTGTLAFMDLFNFFAQQEHASAIKTQILNSCTLHFVPMLNPDGAEVFQRRNAQGIDINRDFVARQSPEAKILIKLQHELQPHFGFNMHDQDTLWSVTGTGMPASISLLAPPADQNAAITPSREKAILLISGLYQMLEKEIPGHTGRWSEEFESRAFGDNFQRLGTSVILVEAGGHENDTEKQYVRKLNFDILMRSLIEINNGTYIDHQLSTYYSIPLNEKGIFHLLIRNCTLNTAAGQITADIGLNYVELITLENQQAEKIYRVEDFGDLSTWNGYEVFDVNAAAVFTVVTKSGNTLSFREGILEESVPI